MQLKEIYTIFAGEKYWKFICLNGYFIVFLSISIICRWQRLENPKNESDPNHHDVAILITRKDICSVDGCT